MIDKRIIPLDGEPVQTIEEMFESWEKLAKEEEEKRRKKEEKNEERK